MAQSTEEIYQAALEKILKFMPKVAPDEKREYWGNENDAESHGYTCACWDIGRVALVALEACRGIKYR